MTAPWTSGRAASSFRVAVSRGWRTSDGERKAATEWVNVVSGGNLAEICNQHLRKGSQVYIEGRLQTRSWEDAGGVKHFRTELVANEMIILDGRSYVADDDYADIDF